MEPSESLLLQLGISWGKTQALKELQGSHVQEEKAKVKVAWDDDRGERDWKAC
jgi:hypothetical protein